jgi:hypothetical protein
MKRSWLRFADAVCGESAFLQETHMNRTLLDLDCPVR